MHFDWAYLFIYNNLFRAFLTLPILTSISIITLTGCQISYLAKSAWNHGTLLSQRRSIENVLNDPKTDEQIRKGLKLAIEAKNFAENSLNLKSTNNYQHYVQLNRPFVSYIVSGAKPFQMEPKLWGFPLVGKLPYKGYFNKADAEKLAKRLKKGGYDTYIRGVRAYSTLGWFRDPILSSMLKGPPHALVNTLIHESVHATIFIKDFPDFNETLATFIGDIGTKLFYIEKEGEESPTVVRIRKENADRLIFSQFLNKEIASLQDWYERTSDKNLDKRAVRLKEIHQNFDKYLKPKFQIPTSFQNFRKIELNNAILLAYQTYMSDFSAFQTVYEKFNFNFLDFLKFCQSLENAENPEKALRKKAKKM